MLKDKDIVYSANEQPSKIRRTIKLEFRIKLKGQWRQCTSRKCTCGRAQNNTDQMCVTAHNESVKITVICKLEVFIVYVRDFMFVFYGAEGHSVQYGNQKQHSGVCVGSSALSVIPLGKWQAFKTDNYFNLTDALEKKFKACYQPICSTLCINYTFCRVYQRD